MIGYRLNSPMALAMIDRRKTATSPMCDDIPNGMTQCEYCGNLIGKNDTYFRIDDDKYCCECEGRARSVLDDFLVELIGRHVSDEALDAIMDDCEQVW